MDSHQAEATAVPTHAERGIRDSLAGFLLETFVLDPEQEIDAEASLLGTGVLDSTGILEVVAHLEETYGIEVEDEEIVPENFDSLAALGRYVAGKSGG